MFVDEVLLKVEAGKGGDGCLAFRREKYVPMGGPFGGNGGHGSDIVFKVDEGLHTLIDLRYMKVIKGDKGENGKGKNQNGKNAERTVIRVPQGTVVTDTDTGLVLADLKNKDDEVVVAEGGRGGRGNTAFKTQSNPAPNFCENGEPGERRNLKVELKLLADVGLVGMPSAGKSTIISVVSKAKPKIAAYHFTTLTPNLGVVKTRNNKSFVLADLPGLIEGASNGEGLGIRFLKHIERTRMICYVLDMSGFEGRDPYDDYVTIKNELKAFNEKLIKRESVIIANKMDMDSSKENLENFKKKVKDVKIFEVTAMIGEGLEDAMDYLGNKLDEIKEEKLVDDESTESYVLYKFKKEVPFTIDKENDVYVVRGKEVERLLEMARLGTDEAELRFANKLRKMGIDDELIKMGIQEGDKVRILDTEFDFK